MGMAACQARYVRAGREAGASAQILQILARLEADGPPGRNANLLAGPWVTADAALSGLHLEHAEPAQFDAISALHREAHGIEYRVDGQLGLHLRDVGGPGHFVDDVDFDHAGGYPLTAKVANYHRERDLACQGRKRGRGGRTGCNTQVRSSRTFRLRSRGQRGKRGRGAEETAK